MHQVSRPQIISPKRKDSIFDTSGGTRSKRIRFCEHSPTEGDILFYGDTNVTCSHPGNQIFANLIKKSIREMNGTETIDHMAELLVKCFATYDRPMNFFIWCTESNKWSQLSTSEVLYVTSHALKSEANKEQSEEADFAFNTNELIPQHNLPPRLDNDDGNSCKSDVTDALTPSGHCQRIRQHNDGSQDVCPDESDLIDTSAMDAFSPYIIDCLVTVLECNQAEYGR